MSAIDLAAAAALYVLLPASFGMGFLEFLGVFLLAIVVVVFSHVPGGVSVFELMVIKLGGAEAVVTAASRALAIVIPYLLALTTFAAGAVPLLFGAIPAPRGRLALLERFVPLPLLEMSHFLGSLRGAALLLLSRGLQRRLDSAWWMTAGLLAAGIILSMLASWR